MLNSFKATAAEEGGIDVVVVLPRGINIISCFILEKLKNVVSLTLLYFTSFMYSLYFLLLFKICRCVPQDRLLRRSSLVPSNLGLATVFELGAFRETECDKISSTVNNFSRRTLKVKRVRRVSNFFFWFCFQVTGRHLW